METQEEKMKDEIEYVAPHLAKELMLQGIDVYACVLRRTKYVKAGTYCLNHIPWVYAAWIIDHMTSEDRGMYVKKLPKK